MLRMKRNHWWLNCMKWMYVANDSLKHENSMLIDKVKALEDVCNSFDDHFDCISGSEKMFENKCELDSVKIAFAPNTTLVNKGKMVFSPPPCVDDICPPVVNKGKRIGIDPCVTNSKSRYVPSYRRQVSQKFIPTCHHYSNAGYILPNCFLLRPPTVINGPSPCSRKLDKGRRVLESVGPKVVGQGKKVWIPLKSKVEGSDPPRRQPPPRCVTTCHQCGKVGHIRPHCHLFRSRIPKKEIISPRTDLESLLSVMRDDFLRLDKLEGCWTIPMRKRYKSKEVEIPHPLRGSDRIPTWGRWFELA
jgi:hypothetical protein